MEIYPRPEFAEQVSKDRVIQNGDTRGNENIRTIRGVGYFNRFQRLLLPHTDSKSVREVHAFSWPGSVLPCTQPTLGGSGPLSLPNGSHLGQSGKVAGLPMQQNHPDCSRLAQHVLVLGPSSHVPDLIVLGPSAQSVDLAIQPDPPQESGKRVSSCLAQRASAIKEQGFSEEVATQIETP